MEAIIFYIFSGFAVLFSLMVILLKNPVTSALSLVASFFCVSGIFFLLHASFLGVIQILIYAGAIVVLFLYVLMLLNIKKEDLIENKMERRLGYGGKALVLVLVLFAFQVIDLPTSSTMQVRESFGTVASFGQELLGPFAIVFELVSLVLLAAILGVVALISRKEKG